MRKRIAFGDLAPDLPPAGHLTEARNVYPSPTGYVPVRAFASITPALPGITGGAAFVASDGTTSFLAGTSSDLYRYQALTWQSKLSGLNAARWRFAQFGDNVIAVNGDAPVAFQLYTGGAALLAGDPPMASMVAVVRDFVVLAGDPTAILTVTWSGFNDSTEWTPTENQSDSQQMLDGGEVMGLAGGEYGIVLQKNAIKRMSYQGGDVIFSFDEISSNVGCMAKGSVAQTGRLVFFLSERGFMVCDGNDVRSIGAQKIDATFFTKYSREDIVAGIYAAVDPSRNVVVWSMPGSPGTLWCYHWNLERWSTVETDAKLVFSGFTANINLDQLDAVFGSVDAIPTSLDDPQFAGANPLFLIATQAGVVGTLGGDPLDALLTTSRYQLTDDRARIRSARPVTDSTSVSVRFESAARAGDKPLVEQSADMRANGEVPLRINAREFVTTWTIRAPWTYAQGYDLEYEPGGRR